MQNHVGILCFFKRTPKRIDKLMRELVDKAYGIREENFSSVWKSADSRRWIESSKEFVLRKYVCRRKSVKKGRLSCIGISDYRNYRR